MLNNKIQPFIRMMQRVSETKNNKIVNAAIVIIQKL